MYFIVQKCEEEKTLHCLFFSPLKIEIFSICLIQVSQTDFNMWRNLPDLTILLFFKVEIIKLGILV